MRKRMRRNVIDERRIQNKEPCVNHCQLSRYELFKQYFKYVLTHSPSYSKQKTKSINDDDSKITTKPKKTIPSIHSHLTTSKSKKVKKVIKGNEQLVKQYEDKDEEQNKPKYKNLNKYHDKEEIEVDVDVPFKYEDIDKDEVKVQFNYEVLNYYDDNDDEEEEEDDEEEMPLFGIAAPGHSGGLNHTQLNQHFITEESSCENDQEGTKENKAAEYETRITPIKAIKSIKYDDS
jgi:hypothetical protein